MMILWITMILLALLCFVMSWRISHRRKKLMETGSCLQAKITGVVNGRGGSAYVLEYKEKGEPHKLHYPKNARATSLPVGKKVVLYLNKENGQAYIEEDDSVVQTEKLFLLGGEILTAILMYQILRIL